MYDDAPTAKELAEENADRCPDCGAKLDSCNGTSEYWGSLANHAELTCWECGYVEL